MDIIRIGQQFDTIGDSLFSTLNATLSQKMNKYDASYKWLVRCEVYAFFISAYDIIYFNLGPEARIRIKKRLTENTLRNPLVIKKPVFCKIDFSAEQFISVRYNDYAKIILSPDINVGQFSYISINDELLNSLLSTQVGRMMLALGDFIYYYSVLKKRITFSDIEPVILRGIDKVYSDAWFPPFFLQTVDLHIANIDKLK